MSRRSFPLCCKRLSPVLPLLFLVFSYVIPICTGKAQDARKNSSTLSGGGRRNSRLLKLLRGVTGSAGGRRRMLRRLIGAVHLPLDYTSLRLKYTDILSIDHTDECRQPCRDGPTLYPGITYTEVILDIQSPTFTAPDAKLMLVEGTLSTVMMTNGACPAAAVTQGTTDWSNAGVDTDDETVDSQGTIHTVLTARDLYFWMGISAGVRLCYSHTGSFTSGDSEAVPGGVLNVHGVWSSCTNAGCLANKAVRCWLHPSTFNNVDNSHERPNSCVREFWDGEGFAGPAGMVTWTQSFRQRFVLGHLERIEPEPCGSAPAQFLCNVGGGDCYNGIAFLTPKADYNDARKHNKIIELPTARDNLVEEGKYTAATVGLCYCPDYAGCDQRWEYFQQIGVLHFFVFKACFAGFSATTCNEFSFFVAPEQRFAVRIECPTDACMGAGENRVKLVAQGPDADLPQLGHVGDCQTRAHGYNIDGVFVLPTDRNLDVASRIGGDRQDYKVWNWLEDKDLQEYVVEDEFTAGFVFPYIPTLSGTETFGVCYCEDACDVQSNWFKAGQFDVEWFRTPCELPPVVDYTHPYGPCKGNITFIPQGGKCFTQCQDHHPKHVPSPEQLTCNSASRLIPPTFECRGAPCMQPPVPDDPVARLTFAQDLQTCSNGPMIGHQLNCTARCRDRYAPETPFLYCEFGQLTPEHFVCSGPCDAPTTIENGGDPACSEGPVIEHQSYCSTNCALGYSPNISQIECRFGILYPPVFGCSGASCIEPGNIPNAAPLQCREGLSMPHGGTCTTQCAVGFAPSIEVLDCRYGALNPPRFTCDGTPCTAPEGIPNAAESSSCEEGNIVVHLDFCTARCADGYVPSVERLSCKFGLLYPAAFRCRTPFEQDSIARQVLTTAMSSDAAALRDILAMGADVDARGAGGGTALHVGALHSNGDVLSLMLDAKASVNAVDKSGWTPLHVAAGRGHAASVGALLKKGADARLKDKNGMTARDVALLVGRNAPALNGEGQPGQVALEGLLAAAERRQFDSECVSTGSEETCSIPPDDTRRRRRWRRRRYVSNLPERPGPEASAAVNDSNQTNASADDADAGVVAAVEDSDDSNFSDVNTTSLVSSAQVSNRGSSPGGATSTSGVNQSSVEANATNETGASVS